MNDAREISSVVKQVAYTARGEVAVVRCTDGSYGMMWDGRLIESLDWASDRFNDCLTFVERLAGSLNVGVSPSGVFCA
jgi:hypothetical protein